MEIIQAFDIITKKVEDVILQKNFTRQPVADSDNEITALYTGIEIAYNIVYYKDKKRVVMRSCEMIEDEPDNTWKTIATWLFDPDCDGVKEAENIGNDFVETIKGPKQTAIQQNQRKKKKDNDGNVDSLFFANRMATYFPELRADIAYEKAHYASFRGITFSEEKIVPKFKDFIMLANDKDISKLSQSLGDIYSAGDLDVKGIITYIMLNSVDDNKKFNQLIENFKDSDKKVAVEARKLRGKKIKPEKIKKQNRYIADTLANKK